MEIEITMEVLKFSTSVIQTGLLGGLVYIGINIYKEQLNKETKENDILKIEQAKEIRIQMFNELLQIKFHYYFTSEILAHFLQNVALKRETINELKESFYLDVSKALNEETKNKLLEIYSVQGIKMYIHQTFLRMLNDANVKYTDENNLSRDALNAVYDINKKG